MHSVYHKFYIYDKSFITNDIPRHILTLKEISCDMFLLLASANPKQSALFYGFYVIFYHYYKIFLGFYRNFIYFSDCEIFKKNYNSA